MANAFAQNQVFTATDLNRRSGYLLDEARLHPVTIVRNERAFILQLMDEAQRQVESAEHAGTVVELAVAVSKYRHTGMAIPAGNAFEWLNGVGQDALRDLVDDITASFHKASSGEATWQEFDAVVDKWRETARVNHSGELPAALAAQAEAVSHAAASSEEPDGAATDPIAAASQAHGARSPVEIEPESGREPVQRPPLPKVWRTGNQTFFRMRRY